MSYVGTIQALISRIGPWFIHQRNIGRFLEAVAVTLDGGITSLDYGLRLGQPLRCDVSALPELAKDRTLRLYPSESELSKRTRLSKWLQLHRTRGTCAGQLKHAQPYFLPDMPVMRIVHQDGAGASASWWTIGASGEIDFHLQTPSNWNYDGTTPGWSRYWVIVYPPAGTFGGIPTYDDGGLYDGGEVYDGIDNLQKARDMIEMFLEWKAGHSRMQAYILATDPASFDPTSTAVTDPAGWTSMPVGNWGQAMSPPPVAVKTRLPTALWIYER